MTATWPASTLGSAPEISGFSLTVRDNVLRSPVDTGTAKRRLRYTQGRYPLSWPFTWTFAQWRTFKSFYEDDLNFGATYFTAADAANNDTGLFAIDLERLPTAVHVGRGNYRVTLNVVRIGASS